MKIHNTLYTEEYLYFALFPWNASIVELEICDAARISSESDRCAAFDQFSCSNYMCMGIQKIGPAENQIAYILDKPHSEITFCKKVQDVFGEWWALWPKIGHNVKMSNLEDLEKFMEGPFKPIIFDEIIGKFIKYSKYEREILAIIGPVIDKFRADFKTLLEPKKV